MFAPHVTKLDKLAVAPSEYLPVAVNWTAIPTGVDVIKLAALTASDCKTAGDTVRVVVPVIEPLVAVIVVFPVETPMTTPLDEIVATDVLELLQVTVLAIMT